MTETTYTTPGCTKGDKDEIAATLAAVVRDAARWRWVRGNMGLPLVGCWTEEELEAAVDAAMEAAK